MVDSMKNIGLSAAGDLGLGQQLQEQVDAAEEERKKKLLQQSQQSQNPGKFGDVTMSAAAMELFGGFGGAQK
jgi:hypothetical protein